MQDGNYSVTQYHTVEYLECQLDSDINGEAILMKVFKKFNAKHKFLYSENQYLTAILKRLQCAHLIQLHFDYSCKS